MKRLSEAFDSEGNLEKHARRQEPVSCSWCRKKKLKCDRSHPCSNCRARKLACSLSSGLAPSESFASVAKFNSRPSSQEIDVLNSRVRKLEALLTTRYSGEDQPSTLTHLPEVLSKTKLQTDPDVELGNSVKWIETDAFEHEPERQSPPNSAFETRTRIAEGFGSFIFALTRPRIAPSLDMYAITTLPPRRQGETLLNFFCEEILWIYHIVHAPTVWKHFNKIYTNIENDQTVDLGPLALISTTFALSAYFSSTTSGLFFKHTEATTYCHKWTLLAQDALSAANCLANPTIETLQSLIYIGQLLMPNSGAIASLRTLQATVTHTARALGLHQTDSNANKKRRENLQVDWVDVEVRRRIWWHICSTDWILSFMSGSQCGTYSISPKQMTVEYPSNRNDSEINTQVEYALPPDRPTEMTYFIFRCKMSNIFREIVDAAWDCECATVEELPFELVLEFDKRLGQLLDEVNKEYEKLIGSFSTYFDTLVPTQGGTDQKLVLLSRQRLMVHFGVHTRLSRLHRPFLVRGAQDPKYAYSRMICLRSVRRVIEIGKNMMTSNDRIEFIKFWSVSHHVFVGLTILVMDYCLNREEPRAKERKEEILECFRLLEQEQKHQESNMATRGLQKLKNILRDGAKPQRVPENEASQKRPEPAGCEPLINYPAPIANTIMHHDPNPSSSSNMWEQYQLFPLQFTEVESSLLDNLNFDVDIDPSLFDVLFMKF